MGFGKKEMRIDKWFGVLVSVFAALWLVSVPIRVSAQFDPLGAACSENSASAACTESKNAQDKDANPVTDTVNNVANLIAIATAVVSIIVIIIAGITMVFSAGESAAIKSARDAIIYAAVGMVVVGLARSIVVFIVNRI